MVDKLAAVRAVRPVAWPFSLFSVDSSFYVVDTLTSQTRTNIVDVVRLFFFNGKSIDDDASYTSNSTLIITLGDAISSFQAEDIITTC